MADKRIEGEVLRQLEGYRYNKQRVAALRYELDHFDDITPDDTIAAMTFAHSIDGARLPAGHTSDKTQYIALHYQERTDMSNRRSRDDILAEYLPVMQSVDRLEHYIALLKPEEAKVINLRYGEGKKMVEIAKILDISLKSVTNIRRKALDRLCEIYAVRFEIQ